MKSAFKKLGIFLFLLIFVSAFSACDDEEEKAQGRVFNNTYTNLYNFSFGDVNFGTITAYDHSEYKDLEEGGIVEFQVQYTDGTFATIRSGYLEAPKEGKKYTIDIKLNYNDDFVYDIIEDE